MEGTYVSNLLREISKFWRGGAISSICFDNPAGSLDVAKVALPGFGIFRAASEASAVSSTLGQVCVFEKLDRLLRLRTARWTRRAAIDAGASNSVNKCAVAQTITIQHGEPFAILRQ